MTNKRIGRYVLKEVLGHGGMASVYLAYDPHFKREVAIKVLPHPNLQEPSFRGRFEREGRLIASLDHPAIVPVFDYDEIDDMLFIVMRYMRGGSLASRMKQGALPLEKAAAITTRLTAALEEVHRRDIVHRDLKPSNILFDQRGEAYLADFGIAKLAEATAVYTGSSLIGTPAYMSPEQFHGNIAVDGRSDTYGLGVILFEMLTGREPFPAESPANYMMRHLLEEPPPATEVNPELPSDLDAVLFKALAKEPTERYFPASALAEDLACVQAGRTPRAALERKLIPEVAPVTEEVARPQRETGRRDRRSLPLYAFGGLTMIMLLGAFFMLGLRQNGDPPPAEEIIREVVVTVVSTPTPNPATVAALPGQARANRVGTATATLTMPTVTLAPTRVLATDPFFVITLDLMNVYVGPGFNFGIIAQLTAGDRVLVIGRNGDDTWYNVELDDGRTGWVPSGSGEPDEGVNLDDIPVAATIPAPPQEVVPTATQTSGAPPPPPQATSPPPAPTSPPPPTATNTPVGVTAVPGGGGR